MDAMERGMRPPVFQDFRKKAILQRDQGDDGVNADEQPDITVEVMDFLTEADPSPPEKKGWILRNVLSKAECQALIDASEQRGYQAAKEFCFMYFQRKNDRLMCHDQELADFLWKRIESRVPKRLEFDTGYTWEAYGLNDRFRICRYKPGGHFGIHTDGIFGHSATDRSFLTCMLYLNSGTAGGDFVGGHTDFMKDNNDRSVHYSLVPETGLCVVFRQADRDCLHSGTLLKSGTKYILRTDVMFRRIEP